MSKLSEPEILARLPMAKGWERHGDMLVRTWQFPSFRRAMEFVNQVGSLMEKTEHYPDLIVTYRTVRIEISTHDVGGLTELDFELIATILLGGGPTAQVLNYGQQPDSGQQDSAEARILVQLFAPALTLLLERFECRRNRGQ